MQAELADELLESRRAFGLAGNVFQNGGIGKHENRRWSLVENL